MQCIICLKATKERSERKVKKMKASEIESVQFTCSLLSSSSLTFNASAKGGEKKKEKMKLQVASHLQDAQDAMHI
jgi:hypothetical protein